MVNVQDWQSDMAEPCPNNLPPRDTPWRVPFEETLTAKAEAEVVGHRGAMSLQFFLHGYFFCFIFTTCFTALLRILSLRLRSSMPATVVRSFIHSASLRSFV